LSHSVENEYLCLKLLQAFGVPAAQAEIADFGGRPTLIVERFDRLWARDGRLLRLPQEDICQALSVPPTRKYQSEGGPGIPEIVALLRGSDTPEEDITVFMRAGVLFWLIGATDGHAKNFSIFLSPGGRFRMTPLYDVLTAQPSFDAGQIPRRKFKLAMSVGTSRHYSVHEIMPRHFMQTADIAGVGTPVIRGIFEDIAGNVEKQAEIVISSLQPGFPEQVVESVRLAIGKRASLLADAN
ncbi:MAG: type II toxin-antitoxin system HipA family toxin, partial [Mesorhizobium sp.]